MTPNSLRRRGSILPLMCLLIIVIIMFVALAIDIGLMVLARNHSQIAADVGALAGVRMLDGISADNNRPVAETTAETAAIANLVLGQTPTVNVTVGTYYYDKVDKKFIHLPNSKPAANPDEAWGAVQVEVTSNQPAFFSRWIGVSDYTASAKATSVHRPRDVALILDFSGSMRFGSLNSRDGSSYAAGTGAVDGSMNPDPAIPNFGPWSGYQNDGGRLWRTSSLSGGGYAYGAGNWTMDSPDAGPAIVKDYYYDASSDPNQSNPNAPVNPDNLLQAFHKLPWDPANVIAVPAPSNDEFRNQTDPAYVGDLWPKRNPTGSPAANASGVSLTDNSRGYARHVADFLRNSESTSTTSPNPPTDLTQGRWPLNSSNSNRGHSKNQGANNFPGGNWEDVGYDFAGPGTFKGYSMGPGYYGKTFFIWPPDPRPQWDWRNRFFSFPSTPGNRPDNSLLFEMGSSTRYLRAPSGTTFQVRYDEILAWIKQEPRTLPPNLRAGRVVFYKSIPSDVNTGTGTAEEIKDKQFWRNYIDHVLGIRANSNYHMYGLTTDAFGGGATVRIQSTPRGADTANPADDPYMHYLDCPRSPLLHMWFGPLSMMDFIQTYNRSWMPGTVHEAQSWQLKVAVNSSLSDIEKNHPNDWVSLIFFSNQNNFNTARVTMGKDYSRMKNALFYPFSLLDQIDDRTQEFRPFDQNFTDLEYNNNAGSYSAAVNIPRAGNGTCPEMGLWVAYNQFSTATGFNGRKGATKFVILETDGVPNANCNFTFNDGGSGNQASYMTGLNIGGSGTASTRAVNAVTRICASDTSNLRGYSTATKARVHGLAFGDLFTNHLSGDAQTALEFLYDVQVAGNTSTAKIGTTWIEDYKVITGNYTQRIERMRTALERIMQSGVQVTLIKGDGEYILP